MDAMLRLVAMLVVHAASLFRMRARVLSGECHADVDPATLALKAGGIQSEHLHAEPNRANRTIEALMVSSTLSVRPSNQEGDLADLTTLTESFSGSPRESRFERHGNAFVSRTRTNRDRRHKAEDDVCGVGLHPTVGAIAPGIRNRVRNAPLA